MVMVKVMEIPQIRSGAILSPETPLQLVVHFHDSASANLAIQLLAGIGVPGDRLGVLPPEKVEGGRGMILSVGCPTEAVRARAETVCRKLGGQVHRHRAQPGT